MRRLPIRNLATTALLAGGLVNLSACWGPIDKGTPGVRTKITPQGNGAEWIHLKTELDGKSPISGGAAAHGSAPASAAAGH